MYSRPVAVPAPREAGRGFRGLDAVGLETGSGVPITMWAGKAAIEPDTPMATGWAGDGAVQEQIDATIKDGIARAKNRMPKGPSLAACESCEEPIPEARQKAVPGVRLCVRCQEREDREQQAFTGYNRRGSKDSQLR